MEQSLSSEINYCIFTQKIPGISWNPKFYYRCHKMPLLVPFPSHTKLIHALPFQFLKDTFQFYLRIFSWKFTSVSFVEVSHHKYIPISFRSHACVSNQPILYFISILFTDKNMNAHHVLLSGICPYILLFTLSCINHSILLHGLP